MKIGTLVKLKVNLLGNSAGAIGICYEQYNIGELLGCSFIFENSNYDGFSFEEQNLFLEEIGYYPLNYNFINVMKLNDDFNKGIFKEALDKFKDK